MCRKTLLMTLVLVALMAGSALATETSGAAGLSRDDRSFLSSLSTSDTSAHVSAIPLSTSESTDPFHCSNVEGKTCSQPNSSTYCYWRNEYGGDLFTYLCTCQYDNYRRDFVWICYCSSCP